LISPERSAATDAAGLEAARVKDLLLQSGALFVREVEDAPHRGADGVVRIRREIASFGVAERTRERVQLAIDLLRGSAESVQGLSGLGLSGRHGMGCEDLL
jgi:hypothetical protein